MKRRSRVRRLAWAAAAAAWFVAVPALGGQQAAPVDQQGSPAADIAVPEQEAPAIVWQPWDDGLFARARAEGKGILLTIYSRRCRPCIASDESTFTDPVVRRLVSRLWIPVRVDRDERPDIDARYQFACAVLSRGKSGLPITGFLFPTGEAMWIDTYIPLEDQESRPGLRRLLVRMDQFWKERTEEAIQNAKVVQDRFDAEGKQRRATGPDAVVLSAIVDGVISRADQVHGGYGAPPRQTNPFGAQVVLLASHRREDASLREQALAALRAAVGGALHDRIGGGFHKAIRDEAWILPYFEKPLSVNAAYLSALIDAYRATGAEEFARTAGETVDFILRVLRAPGGGLYVEQAGSADLADDGSYYVWTVEEARALISEKDLPWARRIFGLADSGDLLLGMPPRFTLRMPVAPDEAARAAGADPAEARAAAGRILEALSRERARRPSPPVIDGRYVDSTALAASALIHAGMALDRPEALQAGLAALDEILRARQALETGVPHAIGAGPGEFSPLLMEDLVHLGNALLDAWEATGTQRYLEGAMKAASGLMALYRDEEGGGFYDVVAQPEAAGYVRLRRKILADDAMPSPQGAAARLLDRTSALSGDAAQRREADRALGWTVSRVVGLDLRISTVALALDAHLQTPVRITLVGEGDLAAALERSAWRLYEPGRIIERRRGGAAASATVCIGDRCREGIVDPASIASAARDLRSARAPEERSVAAP